jgi:hypothetical protein
VRTCSSNFPSLTTTKVYDYKFNKAQSLYTGLKNLKGRERVATDLVKLSHEFSYPSSHLG